VIANAISTTKRVDEFMLLEAKINTAKTVVGLNLQKSELCQLLMIPRYFPDWERRKMSSCHWIFSNLTDAQEDDKDELEEASFFQILLRSKLKLILTRDPKRFPQRRTGIRSKRQC
jgi:hypothetical protein